MTYVLGLAAVASFVFGGFALTHIASDVQIIVAEIGIIGGFLLMGVASVLSKVRDDESHHPD